MVNGELWSSSKLDDDAGEDPRIVVPLFDADQLAGKWATASITPWGSVAIQLLYACLCQSFVGGDVVITELIRDVTR